MSSGVVCVGGCKFRSSDSREEVAIGSGVAVIGVVVCLGEARPSVVESSECSGVVGSFGPCIYSCGGDCLVYSVCVPPVQY